MQLKKFAEMLGVSRATVSLAMNNSPLVAEATKKRIQEAARRFGYFPSPQGRALRRGRRELLRLGGASSRVVLRIEVEDVPLSRHHAAVEILPSVIGKHIIRKLLAYIH